MDQLDTEPNLTLKSHDNEDQEEEEEEEEEDTSEETEVIMISDNNNNNNNNNNNDNNNNNTNNNNNNNDNDDNNNNNNNSNATRRSPAPPLRPPPPIPVSASTHQQHLKAGSGGANVIRNNNNHNNNNVYNNNNNTNVNNNNANNNNNNSKKALPKFKVCTWNLWCMPFSCPRTLSNPYRCATYAQQVARSQRWDEFDGLIVFHLQELWGFKTGIFPPFLLRCVSWLEWCPIIGRMISWLFQFMALLLGLLPILKCLPIMYNPKKQFAHKLRKYLPYWVENTRVPWKCCFDNGLLMCFNKPPQEQGFQLFTSHRCDDSLAAKGFLWAYFEDYKLLVMNLHMQSAGTGKEREAQLDQMKDFIEGPKWSAKGLENILIAGDFNIDSRSNALRVYRLEQMKRMHFNLENGYEGSSSKSFSSAIGFRSIDRHRDHDDSLRHNIISPNKYAHNPLDTIDLDLEMMHSDSDGNGNTTNPTLNSNEESHPSNHNIHNSITTTNSLSAASKKSILPSINNTSNTKKEKMLGAVSGSSSPILTSANINLRSYYTYCNLENIHVDTSNQLFYRPTSMYSPVSDLQDVKEDKPADFGDAIMAATHGSKFTRNHSESKGFAKQADHDEVSHTISLEEALKLPPDHHLQVDIGRGRLKKTFLPIESILGLKKINLYEPTFKRRDWSIDYVLVNFPVSHVKNYTLAKRGGLSDHFLIITDFIHAKTE